MNTPTLQIKHTKLITVALALSSLITFNASACDDKSCETAYLSETVQHISNHVRRAETYKVERHAYSKNRERKAYALYNSVRKVSAPTQETVLTAPAPKHILLTASL